MSVSGSAWRQLSGYIMDRKRGGHPTAVCEVSANRLQSSKEHRDNLLPAHDTAARGDAIVMAKQKVKPSVES